MNSLVLIGRLARDPEMRFIPASGMAVTKFTLAVDKELSKEKKEEAISQGKPIADFILITAFGKQAENCANYLSKGSQCAIHGKITTGSYTTQEGERKYTTNVIADRVEFVGGSKGQAHQGKPDQDTSFFDGLPEDNFQPADDEDIPF